MSVVDTNDYIEFRYNLSNQYVKELIIKLVNYYPKSDGFSNQYEVIKQMAKPELVSNDADRSISYMLKLDTPIQKKLEDLNTINTMDVVDNLKDKEKIIESMQLLDKLYMETAQNKPPPPAPGP